MTAHESFPGEARGRVLETEVMDEAEGVKAYLDGVATAHLDRLDDTFVAAALSRVAGRRGRRVLDVGTGTGAIPVKLVQRDPRLTVEGVDRSAEMLASARQRAIQAGISRRVRFRRADGRRLPFPDRTFDLVVSNSLMHHLPDPVPVLDEIARVLARGGALFIRDLRRPSPRLIEAHIREHGRFYKGTMLRLFADSVRAAFTESEMRKVVERSRLADAGARVRRQFATYLVVELP